MNITIRTANKCDIETLIKFRFMYMTDVEGELSEHQKASLNSQLPEYFEKHMGNDFTAYLAEDNGKAVSVIFMVRLEKPASVHFFLSSFLYLITFSFRKEKSNYMRGAKRRQISCMKRINGLKRQSFSVMARLFSCVWRKSFSIAETAVVPCIRTPHSNWR